MEASALHSVSVAAAVIDDSARVLLVRRREEGTWEPPGGVLEVGEPIHDGLIREVHEETGLDVEPLELSGVYKNMATGVVNLTFRCRVVGGELTEGPESSGFLWVESHELEDLTRQLFVVRLQDAHDEGVAVRSLGGMDVHPSSADVVTTTQAQMSIWSR